MGTIVLAWQFLSAGCLALLIVSVAANMLGELRRVWRRVRWRWRKTPPHLRRSLMVATATCAAIAGVGLVVFCVLKFLLGSTGAVA